jgi:hypothetical protein
MINTKSTITAEFVEKAISVVKLRAVLEYLKDEDLLFPNRVGNLAIIRNNNYIGFIDIGEELIDVKV